MLDGLTHQRWLEVYKSMSIAGIAGNVLANSELIGVEGSTLKFLLDESQSAVFSAELIPKLEQALSAQFNTEISVTMSSGHVANETAAMLGQRLKQERHSQMVDAFERDENVQELVKHFSGIVAKDSISPLND